MGYRPVALEELWGMLSEEEGELVRMQIGGLWKERRRKVHNEISPALEVEPFIVKSLHLVTLNGWFLPSIKAVQVVRVYDSAFEGFRKKKIVLFDILNKKVLLFEKKYNQLFDVLILFSKSMWRLIWWYQKAAETYQRRIVRIADRETWARLLELR